jgi:DsbC/DsbD-like thiol-disulfide interchange protein
MSTIRSSQHTRRSGSAQVAILLIAATAVLGMAASLALTRSSAADEQDGPAEVNSADEAERPLVRTKLVSDVAALAPGDTFYLGVHFDIHEGWGIYWRNPGSTGLETTLDLRLPDGFVAGDVLWPGPERKVSPGDLLDYVYKDETMLLVPVTAAPSLPVGETITIGVDASWLVCKESCVLGDSSMTLTLPVAAEARASEQAEMIDGARSELPVKAGLYAGEIDVTWRDGELHVAVPGARRLTFFPHASQAWTLRDAIATGAAAGSTIQLPIDFSTNDPGVTVTGVLAVLDDANETTYLSLKASRPGDAD